MVTQEEQTKAEQEKEKPEKEVVVKASKQKKEEEKEKNGEKIPAEKEKAIAKLQFDDEDDSIGIKGPIDVENMSASKLMEIAIVMQSRAQKNRLKEQRKEA